MKKKLFLKISLIIAGAVLIFVVVKTSRTLIVKTNDDNLIAVKGESKVLSDLVNVDTDGDSMPDWEEMLRGSDPKDNNSIADRTAPDGSMYSDDTSGSAPADDSKTAQLSKEIFTLISSLTTSGTELTDADIAGISATAVDRIEELQLEKKIYNASDIQTIPRDDMEAIGLYAVAITNLLNQHPITDAENSPLAIMAEALENEDSQTGLLLQPNILMHTEFLQQLLAMPVPNSATSAHLGVVNAVSALRTDIEGLSQVDDDPIIVVGALSQYIDDLDTYAQKMMGLGEYFKNKS